MHETLNLRCCKNNKQINRNYKLKTETRMPLVSLLPSIFNFNEDSVNTFDS